MTLLFDDTQLLLALDLHEDDSSVDAALASLSGAVVTQAALKAKAKSYQARIDRGLAAAANSGASVEELAAAAGLGPDEVLFRLRATPRGLVGPQTRIRLGLDATKPVRVSAPVEPSLPRMDLSHPPRRARRHRSWWR